MIAVTRGIPVILALLLAVPAVAPAKVLFRVRNAGVISVATLVKELRPARVVFFGESHTSLADHRAQRTLIAALHDAGVEVAVGLEMFLAEEQANLDLWRGGGIDDAAFRRIYDRNWTPDYWDLYKDLLFYARQEKIPLVGLNISREIINQVARSGYESLSEKQRHDLKINGCKISARYERLLRRAGMGKDQDGSSFTKYCEAQMVWDTAMARNIATFVAAHPKSLLVVLCGTFHAWRHGIPEQLSGTFGTESLVILPSNDQTYLNHNILIEDADYIWWQERVASELPAWR